MLSLSRKRGERIMIGSNIELTVIVIRGQRVQLGFSAPKEIAINREETLKQFCADQQLDEEYRTSQGLRND